jgi:hypothetical protein
MIYKHQSVNTNLYNLLMNNEFYFAFPDQLNDPMDCKFNIIHEGNENDWRAWLDRFDFFPPKAKEFLFNYMKENGFDEKILFKNDNRFNQVRNSFVICCFTELNDSMKMWSHYSDSHKGICLGFEPVVHGNSRGFLFENLSFEYGTDSIPRNFYPLTEIDYRDEIPEPYNNLKEHPSKLFQFLKTKHTNWREEKEYRLIVDYHIVKAQKFRFNKQHLKEVIFGLKTEESSKKLIMDLVKGLYNNEDSSVDFYEAKEVQSKYEISIVKI